MEANKIDLKKTVKDNEDINAIKKDFLKWSGYPLEGDNLEEIKGCIRTVYWNLSGELNTEADKFEKRVSIIYPEDEIDIVPF